MNAALPPHPRESASLQGVEAPRAAFLTAVAKDRLHHAWLLTGPEGVGKASFAYQAARTLLGSKSGPPGAGPAGGEDPVGRMVAARSHPDLIVLERASADAPTRKSIPVEEARGLPAFFAKAPILAPYRIAIIDAADDLNVNAANAVLKTLEEPSGHGVLFLVSHAPGRLLATLKSRCRRLPFKPWPEAPLTDFIRERAGLDEADARRLAQMAHGAPGRALLLIEQGALELDRRVGAILADLPASDHSELLKLVEGFRGGEGALRFDLLLNRLADRIQEAATRTIGDAGARSWAEAWERLIVLPPRVEGLNLDRADAFWSLMADLRAIARRHPLPC